MKIVYVDDELTQLRNYWDNPGDVNRKAEHGNGVGTHDPWADKKSRDKFKVKTPPEDDKHKWTSPEEVRGSLTYHNLTDTL